MLNFQFMLLLALEAVSLAEAMFKMILILIVLGIIGTGVGFLALKGLAQFLNSRRDAWEETARTFGLEKDLEYMRIVKPLKGVYQGCQVVIMHESDGENPYTICRVRLPNELPYRMEIAAQGYFSRVMDSVFGTNEIIVGVDGFDKSFWVEGSDEAAIQKLLSVHLPGDDAPNLIVDLLSLKKSDYQVKVSHEQIELQKRGELLEALDIEPILEAAIHLAKRIESAREKSAEV